jgi:hypothetical protein
LITRATQNAKRYSLSKNSQAIPKSDTSRTILVTVPY